MSTQPITPADPYAAYGGNVAAGQAAVDPYSSYGGNVVHAEGQGASPNYGAGVTVVDGTPTQLAKGVLREGAQLGAGAYSFGRKAIEAIPGVSGSQFDQAMQAHQQTLDNSAVPQNVGEAMGKTGAQIGSYLLPAKAESALTELAPEEMRFLARIGAASLSSGTMNAANGGSFGVGAAAGAGVGAVGEAARGILAPAFVRSAIPGNISKDAANTVLSETKGIRPSTVLPSVRDRISQASASLDASVANAPNAKIPITPSTAPVQAALDLAGRQRVPEDAAAIQKLMDFLHGQGEFGPARGGTMNPQSPELSAQDALDARRGLAKNFVSNRQWKQVVNSDPQAAAKLAYGALTEQLHNAIPGSVEADEIISNLIPVHTGLKALVRNDPSIVGNVMGRVGARTGALTGTAMAAAGGASSAGLPGAIAGGALGLVGPEVLNTSAAKLALARALYATAPQKAARAAITPAVQKLLDAIR